MARYINKYATLTEYTEDTDARDALGKTVSLIDSIGSLHYDKGNKSPTPGPGPDPTPGSNYVLLNNFISPMPTPANPWGTPNDDNFINTVPSEWESEYQTSDLVSSIPGDPLLDNDLPVDFSSKNIPAGTPFGIVTWDSCPNGDGPRYAIASSSVSNGCTIELWYKSSYSWNSQNNVWLVKIGHNNGNLDAYPNLLVTLNLTNGSSYGGYEPSAEYDVTLRLSTQSDQSGTPYTEAISDWSDGIWHHYALTYDASTNFVHFFIDGHKVNSITDATNDIRDVFTTVSYMKFLGSDGTSIPKGRTAQIAVYNQCKWTDDFEVPRAAY